jgi:hypothetical protein
MCHSSLRIWDRVVISVDGWPRSFARGVGSATINEALLDMAFNESYPDEGEALVLLWRDVCVFLCFDVWNGPGVSPLFELYWPFGRG